MDYPKIPGSCPQEQVVDRQFPETPGVFKETPGYGKCVPQVILAEKQRLTPRRLEVWILAFLPVSIVMVPVDEFCIALYRQNVLYDTGDMWMQIIRVLPEDYPGLGHAGHYPVQPVNSGVSPDSGGLPRRTGILNSIPGFIHSHMRSDTDYPYESGIPD